MEHLHPLGRTASPLGFDRSIHRSSLVVDDLIQGGTVVRTHVQHTCSASLTLPLQTTPRMTGMHEWRNIQDIVRNTFKALHDLIKAQGEALKGVERQLDQKARLFPALLRVVCSCRLRAPFR